MAKTSASNTQSIYLYFGSLTALSYLVLPNQYLVDFTTSFMLKNHLHASAAQVSTFRLVTAIPLYLSFVFGFARDLWNPLGLRDRGYFLIFGLLTAVVFVWLASLPLSYPSLYVGIFLTMTTFRFVTSAYQGLMALVGQEKLMSGRLTAIWQIVSGAILLVAGVAAGYATEHLSSAQTFVVLAVLALLSGVIGLWKPAAVFGGIYDKPQARGTDFFGDVKRLVKHRAVYPAVLIMFLFQFAPGFNTPMQYYLSNTLHAPDAVYGQFNGIFQVSFLPAFFLYSFLCKRYSLKTLLWVGTLLTIPQNIPLVLIHSGNQALLLAVPMGLMGGIAICSYFDLAIRSCPPGMQGTLMMLVDAANLFSTRGSDLLGSVIYDANPRYGFVNCVMLTTAVYALILPAILLIPREVISTSDDEVDPKIEAEMLAEIAATEHEGTPQAHSIN